MTVTTIAGVQTGVLHITQSDDWSRFVGLSGLSEKCAQIRSLLAVAAFVETMHTEPDREEAEHLSVMAGPTVDEYLLFRANRAADEFHFERIRYNSPLEMWLYIPAASVLASAAVHRLLSLWGHFTDMRKRHHVNRLHIETSKLLHEQVQHARQSESARRKKSPPKKVPSYLDEVVGEAVKALIDSKEIAFETDAKA
jgi:hypothetical protein